MLDLFKAGRTMSEPAQAAAGSAAIAIHRVLTTTVITPGRRRVPGMLANMVLPRPGDDPDIDVIKVLPLLNNRPWGRGGRGLLRRGTQRLRTRHPWIPTTLTTARW
ncbi:hypothetical protein ABZ897_36480 [Nonomuraea sp. NPDC046802]|uniref:hypothetical protein n=1 Tax=Nonomuraea sp. NPDC046802 TaxID=3154919 RepID=UPI0033DD4F4F